MFPTLSTHSMFRKIYYGINTVLIDVFVENGRKRTFPENLVKDYNVKKENSDSRNCSNSNKILWIPNIAPKNYERN